jgi:hypothetical protein
MGLLPSIYREAVEPEELQPYNYSPPFQARVPSAIAQGLPLLSSILGAPQQRTQLVALQALLC